MSYQVIARKYRPQRFADVVGQDHVTQTLANAIAQKRIAHAYLFVGPRGTGKTTLARIFAKALNCTDGPKVDFSDDDPRCREIAEGRSLDVIEIDGASNNGVEQVRELRDTCRFAPAGSRFKIYIIDEVHMLTTAAFNALLKTLEEPPAHVKFVFATTDPEKVLPTILSRCQRFDLRRIPAALIVGHLRWIAAQEKVSIDDGALDAIARGAEGGMRDAESTLDQLISFCGGTIQEADVLSMFGLAARSKILSLADAILCSNAESALRLLHELSQSGKDVGRLLTDLLLHFRNLLLHLVSRGDRSLIEVGEAEAGALAEQAQKADGEALSRIMEVLAEYDGKLRDASSKRILLEVALIKAIQAKDAVSLNAVMQRLESLRQTDGGGSGLTSPPAAPRPPASRPEAGNSGTVPPVLSPAPEPAIAAAPGSAPRAATAVASPTPEESRTPKTSSPPKATSQPPTLTPPVSEPAPAKSPPAAGGGNVLEVWTALLEAVGRASAFTRSYLVEAHPVSFAAGTFVIGFDPEFSDHLSLVDTTKTRTLLQTKLKELGHSDARVKFVKAEAPEGWLRPSTTSATATQAPAAPTAASATPGAPASAAKPKPPGAVGPAAAADKPAPERLPVSDFKNDPLIQQALEIFKGTIVEVRG